MTESLNWNAAGLRCRALHKDAHLVVINDAAEQSAVVGILSSINGQYRFCFMHSSVYMFVVITRKTLIIAQLVK